PNTPNGSLKSDQWSHVAITNDGKVAKTYINGKLIKKGPTGGTLVVDQKPLYIACSLDGTSNRYFKGQLADIRIWNQVRTPKKIKNSMNCRLTGQESGLVAYWPLDEGEGITIKDKTGNGNDGAIAGAVWQPESLDFITPAQPEKPATVPEEPAESSSNLSTVITFDGKKDYVDIQANAVLDLTNNFTIEAWIKPELLGKRVVDKGIGGKNEGFTFDTHPKNLRFINKGVYFTSQNQLKTGTWQHVAVTFKHEANGAKLYINGEEENTATPNRVGTVTKLPVRLGSQADAMGNLFKGDMAEVRLWNRVRSQEEIQQAMNHRLRGNEAGLVGYWPLNEGSGTAVADKTSHENSGTLHGGTWKQEVLEFISPATTDQQTATTDQPTTTTEQPTTTTEQPTTTTDQQSTTTDQQSTTTDQQSTTTDQQSTTTEQQTTTTDQQPTTTDQQPTTTEQQPTTTEQQPTTTDQETTTTEQQPTTTDQETTTTEQQPTTTDQQPTTTEPETATTDQETTTTEEQQLPSVLTFDGKDDYIDCGSGINLTNTSFTIEFWAKRQTAGKWGVIVSQGEQEKNHCLHIGFRKSDVFTLAFYGDDLNTGKYTDSDWHHWSCVYNHERQQQIIYCDGQLEACHQPANYQGTGNVYIGSLKGTSYFFEGQLADLRIWQGVRTPQEIQDAMNCRLTGNESGLLAYWLLDEGEGTTIKDQTGNGNDGVIAGAVWERVEVPFEDTESSSNIPIVITVNGEKEYLEIPSDSTLDLIDDFFIRFKWGIAKIEKDDIKIKMKIRRS
ncbi:MAG: LamG domain-containing protein, partial [Symploca sp. SIO2E6]|nr:LamG domain-containing protein [Symploca sp. SIO2E6]